jgi:hypothetical protein
VDFEKVVIKLVRGVIWQDIEEYNKILKKTVNMVRSLYERFKWRVVHEGKLTDSFEVAAEDRQGCIVFPTLFILVLDNVMNKVVKGRKRGLQWRMTERLASNNK